MSFSDFVNMICTEEELLRFFSELFFCLQGHSCSVVDCMLCKVGFEHHIHGTLFGNYHSESFNETEVVIDLFLRILTASVVGSR